MRSIVDVYCDLIDLGVEGSRLDPAKLAERLNTKPYKDCKIIAIFPDTNPIDKKYQRIMIVFERLE